MKKILFFSLGLLSIYSIQAQTIDDALKLSTDNTTGTARFRGMSGAFGALGGDLSALNINPAGSTVFRNNQLGITSSFYGIRNTTDYFNSKNETVKNCLNFNQIGGVMVFTDTSQTNNWKKLAVGINVELKNNFDNNISVIGNNPNNSMAEFFTSKAQGFRLYDLKINEGAGETVSGVYRFLGENGGYYKQLAFLGLTSNVIKSNNETAIENDYLSNVNGGSYFQKKDIVSSGSSGKVTANIAGEFRDVISLGLNLNHHFTQYDRTYSYSEETGNINNNGLNSLTFNETINTVGSGFSFQLGVLIKLPKFRLGAAYESSTWMNLQDEQQMSIRSTSISNGDFQNVIINPEILNIYLPYKLKTPSKTTLSLAYIFGKRGLVSLDYGIKDYTRMQYRPTNDETFIERNIFMEDAFQMVGDLRLGAEYRIKNVSLRAGYRNEDTPYRRGFSNIGDLKSYSGGIGYTLGSYRFDLAYTYAKRKFEDSIFDVGLTDMYKTDSIFHTVTLSCIFEL